MSKDLYGRLLADNGIKIEGRRQSSPLPGEPFPLRMNPKTLTQRQKPLQIVRVLQSYPSRYYWFNKARLDISWSCNFC